MKKVSENPQYLGSYVYRCNDFYIKKFTWVDEFDKDCKRWDVYSDMQCTDLMSKGHSTIREAAEAIKLYKQ